jgi:hypothetical protein
VSKGGLSPERFAADIENAAKKFDVQQSDSTTLLVDLDTPSARAQFERVFPKLRDEFGLGKVRRWKSKSGNDHVAITLTCAEPLETRIALQAALGSDGVRELLAVKRAKNGCVEPCLLFRPHTSRIDVLDAWDVDALS